jgi:biotin synthase
VKTFIGATTTLHLKLVLSSKKGFPINPKKEINMNQVFNLSKEDIEKIYDRPLLELLAEAGQIHRQNHTLGEIQKSALLSIKTGACPEDCGYCSQSAHYDTATQPEKLLKKESVLAFARKAQQEGASRICLGSSGREVKDNEEFERVLDIIHDLKGLGVETCATLGMVKPHQAEKLRKAGLDFYNHNLDTSPEYYSKVITTRTYQDRLDTLSAVREAGMSVCTGGILGMGESKSDRVSFLFQLASLKPQPESVTINRLVPIEGTPLAGRQTAEPLEVVRSIAVARILMPKSVIRLSAGRESLSEEAQVLCMVAGANSIFAGDKLLTTPNRGDLKDQKLFEKVGLTAKKSQSLENA